MRSWPIQFAAEIMLAASFTYPNRSGLGLGGCDPFMNERCGNFSDEKPAISTKALSSLAAMIAGFQICLAQAVRPSARCCNSNGLDLKPGYCQIPVSRRRGLKAIITGYPMRVSAHPLVRELCRTFGGPLVSTSANITGRASALSLAGRAIFSPVNWIMCWLDLWVGAKASLLHQRHHQRKSLRGA